MAASPAGVLQKLADTALVLCRAHSAGLVYCITISSCQDVGDFRRAAEWTEAANRWCDKLDVTGFPGACRIHRAEALRLRGDWPAAEAQAAAHAERGQVAVLLCEVGEERQRIAAKSIRYRRDTGHFRAGRRLGHGAILPRTND
jgi:hypothetical protein